MKRNVTSFTAMVLIFISLLMMSGLFSGIISEFVYFAAFAVPISIGYIADLKERKREEEHDREYKEPRSYFSFNKDIVSLFTPTVFPTVALILAVSYLTSFIIFALSGKTNSTDIGDNLFLALVRHALLPAILEEALFRYMPLRMLARHSGKVTVIISSLYFALAHNSLFSIPYALVAGVIFITLDLMCESVWPSVILHLINNIISVIWIMYSGSEIFASVYYGVITGAALICGVFILINRKKYTDAIHTVLSYGDSPEFMYEPLLLAVPILVMAMFEFI